MLTQQNCKIQRVREEEEEEEEEEKRDTQFTLAINF
jgi:hypothetical protein